MTDHIDRYNLELTATDKGGTSVVRGWGQTQTAELKKVEAAAGTSGAAAGTQFGANFSSTAVAGLQALGAATAGFKLFSFAKSSIEEAVQFGRANAQIAAQIKATGDISGATAPRIDQLAASIEKTQAIFSGTVKQGAALLLTFQEIRNTAGSGNNVFDRTLTVAAAVANVFHKDIQSAILQVGRALENPQAGMQALSRSGLTLERSDRIRILNLAKQGDLLGAQKALLDALESRTLAAGAAAAKADPLQRFSVDVQKFKLSLGQDLTGTAKVALTTIESIDAAFTALPTPVRAGTEALLGVALVALPLLRVKSILDSFSAISVSLKAEGAAQAAVAIEAEAAAATQATVATGALGAEMSTLGPEAFSAEASFAAFNVALETTVVTEGAAAASTGVLGGALAALTPVGIGLGGALGAAAAGLGSYLITYAALQHLVGGHDTPFAVLHGDVSRIAQDIKEIHHDNTIQKGFGLAHFIQQDLKDLKNLNDGFVALANEKGAGAATKAIGDFINQAQAAGVSGADLGAALRPALDGIRAVGAAAIDAAAATGNLNDDFHALTAGAADITGGYLAVADSLDAVSTAAKKVKADQADIAGTSDIARAAVQGEKDAYRGVSDALIGVGDAQQRLSDSYIRLQDSQDRVATSAHSLAQAQRDLNLFNSPRGAEERALQLDIIQRRVVTTPAESDQKRLDLLKFADDNANKQTQLQDALTNAQKGYRDALRSVGDAQRGIVDAQRGVADATAKVQTAEDHLTSAIQKRKDVAKNAAEQLQQDERKLQEAILASIGKIDDLTGKTQLSNAEISTWVLLLKGAADHYAPGSPLDKNIDTLYTKLLGYQKASNALTHTQPDLTTIGNRDRGRALRGGVGTNLSPSDIAALHDLGVPGFAFGGTVPGPRGTPRLAVVHGGERVSRAGDADGGGTTVVANQENHFHGSDAPALADLEFANRELGWKLTRSGRS